MGNKVVFVGLLIALLSAVGCDKGQFLDSTGPVVSEMRETGAITKVVVYDNVNVIFSNSIDSGTIKVFAGKNIIDNIVTDYGANILTIKNENKYNWTRDLDPDIRVYVPCVGIEEIYHESVGKMSCDTALTGNALKIEVAYGNGMIDLTLFYNTINLIGMWGGITDVILKGECNTLTMYHSNYAPFDCRKLHARKVKVTEAGIQNSFVSALEYLEPAITNYGNIYYYGTPEITNHINTGKGKLIPADSIEINF
ncbi:MAG: DUF2807 domain-containing protein [Bacteroidales bacterium]|nr:DUF2807 domain-containing protein [Bacteroidales bacterium]